ncbi:MAG: hypothetical protein K2N71_00260 [Oscillospiraceae bacterium]|nr:hypothetical protein [Oscillospiraceae bacterium]
MKKIFAVTAALVLCLTFTSCGGNNSLPEDTSAIEQYIEPAAETTQTEVTTTSETAVTTAAKKITTTITEEVAVIKPPMSAEEECLIELLDNLQNGKKDMWDFHNNYDFMNDFKVDNYSYTNRGNDIYDVVLTCSESTCELFPNGTSYWVYDWKYDMRFIPKEREDSFLNHRDLWYGGEEPFRTAYLAAVDFSLFTGVFEADAEWFENHIENNVHGFYHAHTPDTFDTEEVPVEDLAKSVKKLYNININTDGLKTVSCAGHGGSWLYDMLAGYEESEEEMKVRVDYCGDVFYLYPTVESEYTFSKNEDGSITLQKVEKIFDRGYEPASDGI